MKALSQVQIQYSDSTKLSTRLAEICNEAIDASLTHDLAAMRSLKAEQNRIISVLKARERRLVEAAF